MTVNDDRQLTVLTDDPWRWTVGSPTSHWEYPRENRRTKYVVLSSFYRKLRVSVRTLEGLEVKDVDIPPLLVRTDSPTDARTVRSWVLYRSGPEPGESFPRGPTETRRRHTIQSRPSETVPFNPWVSGRCPLRRCIVVPFLLWTKKQKTKTLTWSTLIGIPFSRLELLSEVYRRKWVVYVV